MLSKRDSLLIKLEVIIQFIIYWLILCQLKTWSNSPNTKWCYQWNRLMRLFNAYIFTMFLFMYTYQSLHLLKWDQLLENEKIMYIFEVWAWFIVIHMATELCTEASSHDFALKKLNNHWAWSSKIWKVMSIWAVISKVPNNSPFQKKKLNN